MPLYKYRAVDPDGRPIDGAQEAESAAEVAAGLRQQGVQVSFVEEVGKPRGFLRRKPALTWEDVDLFNEQLLAIVRSGLPMAPALEILSQDIDSRRLRPILEDIRRSLEAGNTLETSLNRHPESFSAIHRTVLRAGERTGNLSGVLAMLTAHSSRMVEVKNAIQEAVAYPVLILIASLLLLGFLMTKVIPVFADIFGEFGAKLPWLTRFWLDVSNVLRNNLPGVVAAILVIVSAIVIGWKLLRRTQGGRHHIDRLKLKIPILGKIHFAASVARFSRSLALLLSSKVPVPESFDLAGSAAGNEVLRSAANNAAKNIEGGTRLADALAETRYFDHSYCWMLAAGDARGDVENTLFDLAISYEQRLAGKEQQMVVLLGPVILILVALVVGSVVIGMYLPIFTLSDVISG
ncbi:MAG: type II secretion system F family protein [Candidatus Hydrogenedentes bacterium]|nr:type II secretion system F family protein [Candidatus Hydrogenedentota bacterium]